MTREEFEQTVRRLETYARQNPSGYRLRVGLLAAAGYAYLVTVICATLSLVVLLVWLVRMNFVVFKIGWLLVAFAAFVARAMWVKFPAPEGLEVKRAYAPRLFEMLDELTKGLDAPRIHHVLVTNDYNASVWQVPRLGPLGLHRNYLVLGMTLMQTLPPAQLRAVLAHELGHLSGRHGRFGGWIYRVRETWFRLLARLEQEGRWGAFVFTRFFQWYAPYFHAYSFVLARSHEYEADREAARLAGAESIARALIDLSIKGDYLSGSYWPKVLQLADRQERPAANVYANLASAVRAELPADSVSLSLTRALAATTEHDDTHPSLSDRLGALGYPPGDDGGWAARYEPAPLTESAAEFFFGARLGELVGVIERQWTEAIGRAWAERHKFAQESRRKLGELDEKARAGETLTAEEAWQRASLAAEFRERAEAVPLLRAVLDAEPEHAQAGFLLGRALLAEGEEEEGRAHVERAMKADLELFLPGSELLYGFYRERGRGDEAEEVRRRAQEFYGELEEARRERAGVTDHSELEPHEPSAEELEELRSRLALYPAVRRAYLARKRLQHFPERPLLVVGFEVRRPWYARGKAQADQELLQQLSTLPIRGEGYFVLLDSRFRKLKRAFERTPGALIYTR